MATMNNLADRVAAECNITKKLSKDIIKSVFDSILGFVSGGEDVPISKFGKFSKSTRKARQGINPKTGEKISIAESSRLRFKASSSTKADLN